MKNFAGTILPYHHSTFVPNFVTFASPLASDALGETWGHIAQQMGGPGGEFPAP